MSQKVAGAGLKAPRGVDACPHGVAGQGDLPATDITPR